MTRKGHSKSLHIFLAKLKWPAPQLPASSIPGRLLSTCKYPRTRTVGGDRYNPNGIPAATLSDVDRFISDNFSHLYLRDDGHGNAPTELSPRLMEPPSPDVIRAASHRFFVSPGSTNSLIEEARLSATSSSSSRPSDAPGIEVPSGGVAVITFSRDPYDDFRRSMREMMEAWHEDGGNALDWDFMEELLFCYLELNDRSVHKYILRAFADLTANFEHRVPIGQRQTAATARRKKVIE